MTPYPHLSFCMIGVGVEWSNRTSLTLNISHWVFVTTHASGKPDPFPIRRIVSPRKHMAMKAGISQQAAFLIGRPPEKFRFFCSFSTTTNAATATKKKALTTSSSELYGRLVATLQITDGQQLMQHFQFQAGLIMPLEGKVGGANK